jgi:probable phosphoglycerate mutase
MELARVGVKTGTAKQMAAFGKGEFVSEELPIVYLARHGETAWSLTGQHTGLTDLPLTEAGERNARRLKGLVFAKVFSSPLRRAIRTCELAGFGAVAEIDCDLVEGDYGEYEGRRGAEIRAEHPEWQLFATVVRGVNLRSRWLPARTAW